MGKVFNIFKTVVKCTQYTVCPLHHLKVKREASLGVHLSPCNLNSLITKTRPRGWGDTLSYKHKDLSSNPEST